MASSVERSGRRFEFRCPHCGECVQVDAGMMELLEASSCITCGEPVSAEAFGSGASDCSNGCRD